jgi:hypothetical protein
MNTMSMKKFALAGILALGVTAAGVPSPLSHPGTAVLAHSFKFPPIIIHIPPRPKPTPPPTSK